MPLPLGEEAAHRPLCKLPGRWAEGCRPRSGTEPHFLCLRQRGAQLPHAACAGNARNRWVFTLKLTLCLWRMKKQCSYIDVFDIIHNQDIIKSYQQESWDFTWYLDTGDHVHANVQSCTVFSWTLFIKTRQGNSWVALNCISAANDNNDSCCSI